MGKLFSFKGFMTILIILVVGSLGFFGVLIVTDINENKSENTAATESSDQEENPSESGGQAEAGEPPSEEGFEEAGDLIAVAHRYYNDTTGYGKLEDGVKWSEQRERAEQYLTYIEDNTFEDPPTLQTDMDAVGQYLKQIVDGSKELNNVKQAHRYFHDLDIAINNYTDYKEVWGVTETPVN
ncbi:hypothetical protein GCM10007216_26500 [Thalassobacillus devorans]|uniref:Uncharacterized protein n=1 Tax=Thalassobacillus devorans TaxID=279813 RepID=A0ABQ1PCD9_9BACI|nr:hypothetical protein [Thalassobacillus devorans]NIK29151.1 hypothetical protein [Thalassobacillus devorans]GGC94472.1 hypothetical protein GCM10007216_26500 [Thalassobacillus devorans]